MKKKIVAVISLLFIALSSLAYGQKIEFSTNTEITDVGMETLGTTAVDLKVKVNNIMRKNVGYFVDVQIPNDSKYEISKPYIVDFYTGDPACKCMIPSTHVGRVEVYESQVVELWFPQEPGDYKAKVVITNPKGLSTYSNTAYYEVPSRKAVLKLDVKINNEMRKNVELTAYIDTPIDYAGTYTVDFYTGDPNCKCSVPSEYLGSAEVDKNGVAQLWFNQKEGYYKARAFIIKTPWGEELASNTIYYKVPLR